MVKPIKLLTLLIASTGLLCCSKENEEALLSGATITIHSPIANGQYKYGDTIHVKATVTGSE